MSKNKVLEIGLMPNLAFVHHLTDSESNNPTTEQYVVYLTFATISAPIHMLNIKQHKCKYFYLTPCAFSIYSAN